MVQSSNVSKAEAVDDAEGNLHVPATYRRAFQYVGSWAIAADQGHGSKEFHIVYASPGAIDAYRRDGHFPNDTVLVKVKRQGDGNVCHTGERSCFYRKLETP